MPETFTLNGVVYPALPDNARGAHGVVDAAFHRHGKGDAGHLAAGELILAWIAQAALAAPVAK